MNCWLGYDDESEVLVGLVEFYLLDELGEFGSHSLTQVEIVED